ncbi:hypothetical protein BD289DRAFT_453632 [Coniella lustricola]|uniref:Hydrophobic surface binding protein A-domain-containing protein n=1 Tax=Coniella lustricola TaxID=2025994 RepID=A0A2T3A6K3_9PEZI|nr:hypothetical protein BD289DRAFT_453632 [Coniella lustricola]
MRHSAAVLVLSLVAGAWAQVSSNTSAVPLIDAATSTLEAALVADSGAINQTATNILTDNQLALISDVADLIFDVSQLNTDLLTFHSSVTTATTNGPGGIVSAASAVTQDDITTLTGDINGIANSISALQGLVILLGSLSNVPQVGVAESAVIQTGIPTALQPLQDFTTEIINASDDSGLDVTDLQTALSALQTAIADVGGITVSVASAVSTAPVESVTSSVVAAASTLLPQVSAPVSVPAVASSVSASATAAASASL